MTATAAESRGRSREAGRGPLGGLQRGRQRGPRWGGPHCNAPACRGTGEGSSVSPASVPPTVDRHGQHPRWMENEAGADPAPSRRPCGVLRTMAGALGTAGALAAVWEAESLRARPTTPTGPVFSPRHPPRPFPSLGGGDTASRAAWCGLGGGFLFWSWIQSKAWPGPPAPRCQPPCQGKGRVTFVPPHSGKPGAPQHRRWRGLNLGQTWTLAGQPWPGSRPRPALLSRRAGGSSAVPLSSSWTWGPWLRGAPSTT